MNEKNRIKAFPNEGYASDIFDGVSLRDYFACVAMQSFLSFQDIGNMNVSKEAYMMADAMMEARNDNK